MKRKFNENNEIDVLQLLRLLRAHIVPIMAAGFVFAALFFVAVRFFVTPQYKASVLLYVNNSTISVGSTSVRISSGELSAAQSLVDTYVVVLNSRSNLETVIQKSGVKYTYEQLSHMISAGAVNDTEIFEVSVTSPDPGEARLLANTIAEVLPDRISDIVDNSSVRVVDYAVTPRVRVSPSYTRYTAIGLLLGLLISSVIVILRDLYDDIIRDEDFLLQNYQVPVLASIPDLTATGTGKYGYYYKGYNKKGGYEKSGAGERADHE